MGLPFWSPYANSTPLILLQCARCRVTYSRAGLNLYFAFGMLVFLAEIRHRFELSQDNFRVCLVIGASAFVGDRPDGMLHPAMSTMIVGLGTCAVGS